MKKSLKMVSLLLAAFFIISLFAGCSNIDKVDKDNDSQSGTNNEQKENEETEETKDGPSWTWDTSPVEIDWYISEGWFNKLWDAKNCLVDKTITEKTGVTLNISTPAGDAQEKLNTMIAANTLPDVMTMGSSYGQFQQMQGAGMLYPLNELMDKYAPTMKEIVPESMIQWYTYDDGNWYGLPNFFWAKEHLTDKNYIKTNAGMMARKDIMDKLGIKPEDFNTQEGFIEALKKVKDAKLEYNGIKVTPVYFGVNGGTNDTLSWIFPGMFAIPLEDSEGNLIDRRMDPKYVEMLKFSNQVFREGLMSKENFTSDRKQIQEKMVSGGIFLYIGNMADYKGEVQNLYGMDNNALYVPVGPVTAQDGEQPMLPSTGMNGWTVTMISKEAKNPERIIRFLEFLYSEEGNKIHNYGVEGVTYNIEDGKVVWTDEYIKALQEDPAAAKLKYGVNTFYWINNPVFLQTIEPLPATKEDEIVQDISKHFSQWVFNDGAFDNLNPSGGTDEAAISAEIGVYWGKQVPKMIMAKSEEEVQKIYDETIKRMKSLGWEDMHNYKNEKFKANKEKLGIDFAWPLNEK